MTANEGSRVVCIVSDRLSKLSGGAIVRDLATRYKIKTTAAANFPADVVLRDKKTKGNAAFLVCVDTENPSHIQRFSRVFPGQGVVLVVPASSSADDGSKLVSHVERNMESPSSPILVSQCDVHTVREFIDRVWDKSTEEAKENVKGYVVMRQEAVSKTVRAGCMTAAGLSPCEEAQLSNLSLSQLSQATVSELLGITALSKDSAEKVVSFFQKEEASDMCSVKV